MSDLQFRLQMWTLAKGNQTLVYRSVFCLCCNLVFCKSLTRCLCTAMRSFSARLIYLRIAIRYFCSSLSRLSLSRLSIAIRPVSYSLFVCSPGPFLHVSLICPCVVAMSFSWQLPNVIVLLSNQFVQIPVICVIRSCSSSLSYHCSLPRFDHSEILFNTSLIITKSCSVLPCWGTADAEIKIPRRRD